MLSKDAINQKRYNERWPERNKASLKKYAGSLKGRFRQGIATAKAKGLSWTLALEQFVQLSSQLCHYCKQPTTSTGVALDRIDNDKGYSIDNVLPCCTRCNLTRGNRWTVQQMEVMIKAVVKL